MHIRFHVMEKFPNPEQLSQKSFAILVFHSALLYSPLLSFAPGSRMRKGHEAIQVTRICICIIIDSITNLAPCNGRIILVQSSHFLLNFTVYNLILLFRGFLKVSVPLRVYVAQKSSNPINMSLSKLRKSCIIFLCKL